MHYVFMDSVVDEDGNILITYEDLSNEVTEMQNSGFFDPNSKNYRPFGRDVTDEQKEEQIIAAARKRVMEKRIDVMKLIKAGYSLEKQDRNDEADDLYYSACSLDRKTFTYYFAWYHKDLGGDGVKKLIEDLLDKKEKQAYAKVKEQSNRIKYLQEQIELVEERQKDDIKELEDTKKNLADIVSRDLSVMTANEIFGVDEIEIGMSVLILDPENYGTFRVTKIEPDSIKIEGEYLTTVAGTAAPYLRLALEGVDKIEVPTLHEGIVKRIVDGQSKQVEISSPNMESNGIVGTVKAIWRDGSWSNKTL
tara:strand:+ start:80 stop:1000 length:921 start_codon:yes stop_codon:yes gene_type:complete